VPRRSVGQRLAVLMASIGCLLVIWSWSFNLPEAVVLVHRSTLLLFLSLLWVWSLLWRLLLLPLVRTQARRRLRNSPALQLIGRHQGDPRPNRSLSSPVIERDLLLVFVAYHPSPDEVAGLQRCLEDLDSRIGYALVVNDHLQGEPVEALAPGADHMLYNSDNPGYGKAVNRLVSRLDRPPPFLGVLNTDLLWSSGSFETLLHWLQRHSDVALACPQILDEAGTPQQLCKQHPTALGLFSRRFIPAKLKPRWLRRYDAWYVMAEQNYTQVFEVPYLSGCCMLMRSDAFRRAGGFDERFFLYLEDADITRSLQRFGRCVHLPKASVIHGWGRGNYRNLGLMLVNLSSAWHYFRKWGWRLW
jgi:GT2 family glycosyltransferase